MKRRFKTTQLPSPGRESVPILFGVDQHPDGGGDDVTSRPIPNSFSEKDFGSYLGPDMEAPHSPRVGIYNLKTLNVEEVHVDRPPITGEWIVEEVS